MAQMTIPNPIISSPFDEPQRHFYFDDDGITDKVVESRRLSSYFVPVPKPKKKGAQLALDSEWTQDRMEENKFINEVRSTVAKWRAENSMKCPHTTTPRPTSTLTWPPLELPTKKGPFFAA
jgi:type III restriction enzyme